MPPACARRPAAARARTAVSSTTCRTAVRATWRQCDATANGYSARLEGQCISTCGPSQVVVEFRTVLHSEHVLAYSCSGDYPQGLQL